MKCFNEMKNKKYHTVETILKYHTVETILKYHTVETILKNKHQNHRKRQNRYSHVNKRQTPHTTREQPYNEERHNPEHYTQYT